ncbi:DUF2065 domain-containing protein [Pseudahrensia aquimaris]|uniref:DUF2065 domain-containing protein n=1 Tax=Pseudahrensia aquimaris TaxID=744461 RepID=A0ABW3FKZ3_9HYPH
MSDLLVAIGLFLALEGALYAGLPAQARKMAFEVSQMNESYLRKGGMIALVIGVGLVWLVRG